MLWLKGRWLWQVLFLDYLDVFWALNDICDFCSIQALIWCYRRAVCQVLISPYLTYDSISYIVRTYKHAAGAISMKSVALHQLFCISVLCARSTHINGRRLLCISELIWLDLWWGPLGNLLASYPFYTKHWFPLNAISESRSRLYFTSLALA